MIFITISELMNHFISKAKQSKAKQSKSNKTFSQSLI